MSKKSLILCAAVATALSSGAAFADLSTNASATSNYIWRGVTQSSDTASVAGGVDWSHESGVYAGMWSGSLVGGAETDLYVGFAGEAGDVGYDVGVVTYQYTTAPDINFTELYLNGTYSIITVGIASTIDSADGNKDAAFDKGDLYVSASADFAAGPFDASVFAGSYMFDNDNLFGNGDLDYAHYGVSLSSGEVTVALEKNDIESPASADNVRVVATWSKSWDI